LTAAHAARWLVGGKRKRREQSHGVVKQKKKKKRCPNKKLEKLQKSLKQTNDDGKSDSISEAFKHPK